MWSFKAGARRGKVTPKRQLTLEQLEDRAVPATAIGSSIAPFPGDGTYVNPFWGVQGTPGNDQIVIDQDPTNAGLLRAWRNGQLVDSRAAAGLTYIEVHGGAGNDAIQSLASNSIGVTLFGDEGNDTLVGGGRDDSLHGGDGNDALLGGAGQDLLNGDAGDDFLSGEAGNDQLVGGIGNDILQGNDGGDFLMGNGTGTTSGSDDDQLDGGTGVNLLNGGGGNDVLTNGIDANKPNTFGSDATLQQFLIDRAVNSWSYLLGQHFNGDYGQPPYYYRGLGNGAIFATSALAIEDAASTVDHSNTNVQVQGVDEADLVKTDGNFIYMLSHRQLLILKATPADQMEIVSQTDLEDTPSAIYLDGDRLTVIASNYGQWAMPVDFSATLLPWGGSPRTHVTVFDVSNRTAPRAVQDTWLDGSFVTSRAIGDNVYVVVQGGLDAPHPLFQATDAETVYETESAYRARLEAGGLDLLLPGRYVRPGGAGTPLQRVGPISTTDDVYTPFTLDDTTLRTVAVFDVTRDESGTVGSATSFGSYSSVVYASTTNLYIADAVYTWPDLKTRLQKFHLDGANVTLTATGEVAGQLLNSFSLDEHNGNLRVATTVSWGTDAHNNVSILAEQNGKLNVIGSLENLAPGERIFAVRFLGDQGFVVTFRQTDPLFALDLSNPTSPKNLGELHVPGFSSYLHPIADGYLLSIGRDADENGRVRGLQISLFDVRDMSAPKRVAQRLIAFDSSAWSWQSSTAEWDHHAFSYFPEQGILAVPVEGWRYSPENWDHESNLWVFQIENLSSFKLLGQVQHDDTVLRSLRIEDKLYSIARDSVKVQSLLTPGDTISTLPLPEGDDGVFWPIAFDTTASGVTPTESVAQEVDLFRGETGVPVQIATGTAVQNAVIGSFRLGDGQSASGFTATINWGDNQPPTTGQVINDNGVFRIAGSHDFAGPGRYTIRANVRSEDGKSTGVLSEALIGTPNERFVAQLYQDVLGRQAETAGLNYWTAQLTGGTGRDQLARMISSSTEARARVIQGLYTSLLGRAADTAGMQYFQDRLAAGATPEDLKAVFFGSAEFASRRDATSDRGFLVALYNDVLGRSMDPAGELHWSHLLTLGASRTDVAAAVLGSAEAHEHTIRGAYQGLLGREADYQGLQFFVGSQQYAGWKTEQVLGAMIGSDEYFSKV